MSHLIRKIYFLILIQVFVLSSISYAYVIPDSILTKCNTAKDAKILTINEKNAILYTNIIRCYPKFFLNEILIPYLDSANTKKTTKYYKTIITDLNSLKPLKPLFFNEKLYPYSKAHAKDMGRHKMSGHNSSKGVPFEYRMGEFNGRCSENCSYGYNNPLDIVIQLLLDEGVPSFGHRKNMLDPTYFEIAVSIQKHREYKWNCVMDLLGK